MEVQFCGALLDSASFCHWLAGLGSPSVRSCVRSEGGRGDCPVTWRLADCRTEHWSGAGTGYVSAEWLDNGGVPECEKSFFLCRPGS